MSNIVNYSLQEKYNCITQNVKNNVKEKKIIHKNRENMTFLNRSINLISAKSIHPLYSIN